MLTRTPLRHVFANSFASLIGAPKLRVKQTTTLFPKINNIIQSSISISKRPDINISPHFNHHQSIRSFSTTPIAPITPIAPTTIVKDPIQLFEILTKSQFFESEAYNFVVSIFEDKDNQEVFTKVKSNFRIKEFFADYLFKLCDHEHQGSFQLGTLENVLAKMKNDEEFAKLEFKVLDKDRSGTLSKSEVTRISKRISIFIIIRQIALTLVPTDSVNIDKYFATLCETLKIFDQQEHQNHCIQSFKKSIQAQNFECEVTFEEFWIYWNLEKWNTFDYVMEVIDRTLDPDIRFCYKFEQFRNRLDDLKFFEQTFSDHYELFIDSFPIFMGKVQPTKFQATAYFTYYLFFTFSNQQKGIFLMYRDIDKYLNGLKTLKSKDDIIEFFFKNYSSKGFLDFEGAKQLLTHIVIFRSISVPDFHFDLNTIDKQHTFGIAKKCVNSEKIGLSEFKSLIQSEQFVPLSLQ